MTGETLACVQYRQLSCLPVWHWFSLLWISTYTNLPRYVCVWTSFIAKPAVMWHFAKMWCRLCLPCEATVEATLRSVFISGNQNPGQSTYWLLILRNLYLQRLSKSEEENEKQTVWRTWLFLEWDSNCSRNHTRNWLPWSIFNERTNLVVSSLRVEWVKC